MGKPVGCAELGGVMSKLSLNRRRSLLVALVDLATGCATLPAMSPRPQESAMQDVTSSPLAALAAASASKERPDWSGFRLFYSGESAFNARIALVRRATHSLDVQVYHLAYDETGRGFGQPGFLPNQHHARLGEPDHDEAAADVQVLQRTVRRGHRLIDR